MVVARLPGRFAATLARATVSARWHHRRRVCPAPAVGRSLCADCLLQMCAISARIDKVTAHRSVEDSSLAASETFTHAVVTGYRDNFTFCDLGVPGQ